jgi:hypothetical protein
MDAVIEAIGEYIKDALRENKPHIAKGILMDVEMWYEDHIKSIHTAKKLMGDSVFISVYCCGYENINWYEVRSSLEVYFCDEIDEALCGKEEDIEDDIESDEAVHSDSE